MTVQTKMWMPLVALGAIACTEVKSAEVTTAGMYLDYTVVTQGEGTGYDHNTVLIGHDLGGVIASMAALKKPPRAVVLSGTALGNWWFWTRLSAAPLLNRFFYHTFKGNLFVQVGGGQSTMHRFSNHPHFHDPSKMMTLAKHMKPPKNLALDLATKCPVYLIWGKNEVFYPGFIAKRLSKDLLAPLHWNEGGHYCMWTHAEDFYANMLSVEQHLTRH